jgi:transposase
MSLPVFDPQTHLFGLQARSSEVFSETDRYRLFAQKIYPLLVAARPKLEACYCTNNGRPGVEPVVLLGVSVLQFLERVPDRQAVDLVKYHIGWKHALAQELDGDVFDPTVLVRFRERLIEHEQGRLAFELVLGGLERAGLVKQKGKQRLDSTHVLGLVSRMGTLECVRESLRLALEELAEAVSEGQRPEFWNRLWERYVDSQLDYKAAAETLKQKTTQAGTDVLELRTWLETQTEAWRQGEKVELLERVWSEQFEVAEGGGVVRKSEIPATPVQNPHDPEAQWCTKKTGDVKKEWVGYKTQVAETVPEEPLQKGEPTPAFITGIVTQPATGSDEAGLAEMLDEQAEMGMEKAAELYVDGAYVSGQVLAEAEAEGRQLMGPAQPPAQTGKSAYKPDAFDMDVEQRRAVCPAGHTSMQCSRLEEEKTGKVTYRFEWSTHCHSCPLRAQCVPAGQKHRTLAVGQYHTPLEARRREMKTEAFQKQMKQRNAIEGTHSELVRAHGLRRARYRGLKKVTLQNYLIGAACNAKRWIRRLQWEMKQAMQREQCVPQAG